MLRNIVLGNASFRSGKLCMKLGFFGFCCVTLSLPSRAQQQRPSTRLSDAEFVALARRCAPDAPPDTLLAIARTESGLYANAISINRPRGSAKSAGYREGEVFLSKQPRNPIEATRWMRWLGLHHFSVSIGLMQVNAETAGRMGVNPEKLLEPCTNLQVGQGFSSQHTRHSPANWERVSTLSTLRSQSITQVARLPDSATGTLRIYMLTPENDECVFAGHERIAFFLRWRFGNDGCDLQSTQKK